MNANKDFGHTTTVLQRTQAHIHFWPRLVLFLPFQNFNVFMNLTGQILFCVNSNDHENPLKSFSTSM